MGDEFGARFKFSVSKLEVALMAAELISNSPTQMLAPPGTPLPPGAPTVLPMLSEYSLLGSSFNFTSGAWQFKTDLAYKTDQLVEGTINA